MTRALYVIGEPGVGKSTLMAHLTAPLGLGEVEVLDPSFNLVKGRRWTREGETGVELGGAHDTFPGTDRLSMGVSPQAVDWLYWSRLPDVILAEGQRLSGRAFLTALAETTALTALYLTAAPSTAAARRAVRGTDQNDAWVRGAATKALRAAQVAHEVGAEVVEIPTDGLPPAQLAAITRAYIGL